MDSVCNRLGFTRRCLACPSVLTPMTLWQAKDSPTSTRSRPVELDEAVQAGYLATYSDIPEGEFMELFVVVVN